MPGFPLGRKLGSLGPIMRMANWVIRTMESDDALVPIPALGHQDVAVVESLMRAARFFCRVHEGFGESPGVLFVRAKDLPAVKELLQDYRIRSVADEMIPIPW
jgi:hypothetical protein